MNTPRTNILLSWCGVWGIVFLITSCSLWNGYPEQVQSALEQAGPNRRELVKVLTYYAQDPADSLKLRAAEFLIGNMPGHSYQKRPDIFDAVFDSAARYSNRGDRTEFFKDAMKRIKRIHPSAFHRESTIKDIKHVTASFLIQNINLAFKAYHQIPKEQQYTFDTFCHFVLPYRAGAEPLEFDNRKRQYQHYHWAFERLQAGHSFKKVIHSVLDSMHITSTVIHKIYPGKFSGRQVELVHFGTCGDLVNYMVNALRAIGIPASYDFTPHWGNHYGMGHSWIGIHRGDSKDVIGIGALNKRPLRNVYEYQKASMPKIYRHSYKRYDGMLPFWKDITAAYISANEITVPNKWSKNLKGRKAYLAVFDRSKGWAPVASIHNTDSNSFTFKNVGTQIVFLTGYYDKSHRFHSLNYPFIVDDDQQVHYLNPEKGTTIDSVIVQRKYPPFFVRNRNKINWIRSVNRLVFQASNTLSFHSYVNILDVQHFNSSYVKTIPLSYPGKFKYYRIAGPPDKSVWLGTLRLVARQDYQKTYTHHVWGEFNINHLIDNDPLTHRGGPEFNIKYVFSQPVKIQALQLQARNGDDYIDRDDRYRLMKWDQGWKSLGTKVARDTMLVYHNLPQNALYWLRDLTEGHEEEVFTLTANGRQWWPGVSNYAGSAGNSD